MNVNSFLKDAGSKEPKKNQKSVGNGRSQQMKKKGKANPPVQAKAKKKPKTVFVSAAPATGAPTGKKKKVSAKKRKSLYVGRGNNSAINLKRLGGVGHSLGLQDLEKYIKPVMLIATGAVGAAFMDGKFIKGFVEDTLGVSEKWSPSVRTAIALAIGFTVARFSKKEEAKLVAIGLSGQQVLEFVRTLAEKANISFDAKPKATSTGGVKMVNGATRVSPFALSGVKRIDGVNRVAGVTRLNLGTVPQPISGARAAAPAPAPAPSTFSSEFPV